MEIPVKYRDVRTQFHEAMCEVGPDEADPASDQYARVFEGVVGHCEVEVKAIRVTG